MLSGGYYWMVGDSSSGKTVFTVGCMAEASINPQFKHYDLIFDNTEDGALMPVEKFYGPALAKRMQPPRVVDGQPVFSETVEQLFFHLDDRLEKAEKTGKPFIYLQDSVDSLDTKYAEEKFQEKKTEDRGGKKAAGDYGDGKAKIISQSLRRVVGRLRKSGSILILLSQTRDNPAALAFQPKKVVAGGRALKFYAQWQLWSSLGKEIKKEIHGTERQIGITSRISIEKNRLTGKEWVVELPIYWSFGLDDVGSCVDYLCDEKRFKIDAKNKSMITECADFNFKGKREELIQKINNENLESELRNIVTETWKEVEQACTVKRKNKYTEA